jgi:hypothetical protein
LPAGIVQVREFTRVALFRHGRESAGLDFMISVHWPYTFDPMRLIGKLGIVAVPANPESLRWIS